jgi:hypothetical protein
MQTRKMRPSADCLTADCFRALLLLYSGRGCCCNSSRCLTCQSPLVACLLLLLLLLLLLTEFHLVLLLQYNCRCTCQYIH